MIQDTAVSAAVSFLHGEGGMTNNDNSRTADQTALSEITVTAGVII